MKIQIWLSDQEKIKESEILGADIDSSLLVDFYFKLDQLIGFWIDPDENSITGSKDIIFYFGGDTLRTPYKKSLADLFYKEVIS